MKNHAWWIWKEFVCDLTRLVLILALFCVAMSFLDLFNVCLTKVNKILQSDFHVGAVIINLLETATCSYTSSSREAAKFHQNDVCMQNLSYDNSDTYRLMLSHSSYHVKVSWMWTQVCVCSHCKIKYSWQLAFTRITTQMWLSGDAWATHPGFSIW